MRPSPLPAAASLPVSLLAAVAMLAAGPPARAQSEAGGGASADPEPAPAVILSLGAGPEGSAAHALGGRIADGIAAATGWTVRVEPTGGALPNAILIQEGRIDLALVSLDLAWAGLRGEIEMVPGLVLDGLRGLAPVDVAPLRVEPVRDLDRGAGLAGLRIGVPEGEDALAAIVAAFEGAQPVTLTAEELETAADDDRVDALATLEGGNAPPPPLAPGPEEVAAVLAATPWLVPATIRIPLPEDSDPAVTTPLPPIATVGLPIWLVARADLDQAVARAVTAATIDAVAVADTPADPNAAPVLPIHPGAASAWKVAGVAIPAERVAR